MSLAGMNLRVGPALSGMAGLGTLAGTSDANMVLQGTELILTANLVDYSSFRLFYVPQDFLDRISEQMRSFAYDVISATSSYSQISFDVVNRTDKNNVEGVLQDFSNAISNAGWTGSGLGADFYPSNVLLSRVVHNPRYDQPTDSGRTDDKGAHSSGSPTPTPTPAAGERSGGGGGAGAGGSDAPVTHAAGAKDWSDGTPYKTGIYSVDAFLDSSFAGGAVSGTLIAMVVGGVVAWKVLR